MKLPWSFRICQAWELIVHGTDRRYDEALDTLMDEAITAGRLQSRVTELESDLRSRSRDALR